MQKYKEINGNDYVKNSRTTINETMQSIQSMNSGAAFPTNNLFEGMKCYRTDLKKTYTLTDVANNTWVEDSHATLADEATHADSATKATNDKNGADITATYLKKAGGTATGDITAPNFKGNLSGNADTATKLSTARKINITGNATGAANFDGSSDVSINTTVNESKHAAAATSWGTTTALVNDIATVNNSDTWIPVVSNGKLQHTEKLNMKVGAAVTADKVNDAGNKTAIKDGTREPDGLHLYQCYDNGYPTTYGNLLSIGGAGGGELLAGWSGADKGIEHLYYRNRRNAGALWSDWRTVAFTSDINRYAPTKTGTGASGTWGIDITGNAATATRATTATDADKLDGYHASDIINRITAANMGGIVAASLTENGYAKFANGLILQWGNVRGRRNTENSTSFPIAFPSTCFTVLLTPKRYIVSSAIISQGNASFTWEAECDSVSWIAVGN